MPKSKEARNFYRCALHREEEAKILLRHGKTTGAVYLNGYAVECVLKALLLDSVPDRVRMNVLNSFRGKVAHDLDWLRSKYLTNGGAPLPKPVTRDFALVAQWTIDLRYDPSALTMQEAADFVAAATVVLRWAEGRFSR